MFTDHHQPANTMTAVTAQAAGKKRRWGERIGCRAHWCGSPGFPRLRSWPGCTRSAPARLVTGFWQFFAWSFVFRLWSFILYIHLGKSWWSNENEMQHLLIKNQDQDRKWPWLSVCCDRPGETMLSGNGGKWKKQQSAQQAASHPSPSLPPPLHLRILILSSWVLRPPSTIIGNQRQARRPTNSCPTYCVKSNLTTSLWIFYSNWPWIIFVIRDHRLPLELE